ncbi:MAG: transposase [Acidobacteria bacterium]|nr:transposase [Acidobacteriota bacterium]
MSRPTRIECEGAPYHVMSRGVARMPVLVEDADRRDFLDRLGEGVGTCQLVAHAFCMMPSHYHLLCETPLGVLGRWMRVVNGVYAQTFNRRHHRVGHL